LESSGAGLDKFDISICFGLEMVVRK